MATAIKETTHEKGTVEMLINVKTKHSPESTQEEELIGEFTARSETKIQTI